MKSQTIQIFLPDGSPTSIKEAELTNRLVKAILFPRNKIQEVAKREGVHYTGVYFLFGNSEDGAKPKVYIGEGEDCFTRIQQHNRKKDFWTHCVIITTKTDEYTKTDAKFLEYYCLDKAQTIGRYVIDNDTGSKKPSLSESREFDLLDNFENAKILLATLGYPIFEEKRKASSKDLFYCKGKQAKATGEMTDEGFVVFEGSTANLNETKTIGDSASQYRWMLLKDNSVTEKNRLLFFTRDVIFSSPSAASSVILGRSSNGWTEWKNKEGKTLDEIKRK